MLGFNFRNDAEISITLALNLVYLLSLVLQPFMPATSDEIRRQPFPRFSGAVECRSVLSVPAASAAGALDAPGRDPDRPDLRAVSCGASVPRRAAALADPLAARRLGGARRLHLGA